MPKNGYSNFNEEKKSVIYFIVNYYAKVRPHKQNGDVHLITQKEFTKKTTNA